MFKINLNFYYKAFFGRIGGSAAYFLISGSNDQLRYAPDPVDGSGNGSPDSNGFIFEADYLPLDYLRLALQYTIYNKFNGGHTNYDGVGRNASGQNALFFCKPFIVSFTICWQINSECHPGPMCGAS